MSFATFCSLESPPISNIKDHRL